VNVHTKKIQATSRIFHSIPLGIFILHYATANTAVNTINAKHARCMMGRLDVIPSNVQKLSVILIGSIFNGMILSGVEKAKSLLGHDENIGLRFLRSYLSPASTGHPQSNPM